MGAAAGVVCAFACSKIKAAFGYDDALDVFGVHGVGGTLGAILTGVFATRAVSDLAKGQPLGLMEGGGVLKAQIVAVIATWILSIVATFIILKIVDAIVASRSRKRSSASMSRSMRRKATFLPSAAVIFEDHGRPACFRVTYP
jgi:Amt family ammonium transporter